MPNGLSSAVAAALEPSQLVASNALHAAYPSRLTSFGQYAENSWAPQGPYDPLSKYKPVERFPREQVPLCEDLKPGVLQAGEKCWSKCGLPMQEDCMPRVLSTPEEGKLEMIKRPGCSTHIECVGEPKRVLCEAKHVGWDKKSTEDSGDQVMIAEAGFEGVSCTVALFEPDSDVQPSHKRRRAFSLGANFL
eukprot:TRINITY_DN7972_c0_g1_i1.p1 TRINITY_DN7972_c0_g1~~TRINITY_DN7972_c0_g1_i1.p1  ORF type:complete len:191 (-),score=44.48 TRINITY_DN7972_c0_g1_i1:80-652(-)